MSSGFLSCVSIYVSVSILMHNLHTIGPFRSLVPEDMKYSCLIATNLFLNDKNEARIKRN